MALQPTLDPELAALVARSRQRAAIAGEFRPRPAPPFASSLSPEAQSIVREWLYDGGYDEAVTRVVADDPELAIE